ncbi:hypothetical protein JTB14_025605 [Gonioctena quinquepunctata]|nr:hypothetical protein JTB14_025605 [Gonioctena quinquepunctata]
MRTTLYPSHSCGGIGMGKNLRKFECFFENTSSIRSDDNKAPQSSRRGGSSSTDRDGSSDSSSFGNVTLKDITTMTKDPNVAVAGIIMSSPESPPPEKPKTVGSNPMDICGNSETTLQAGVHKVSKTTRPPPEGKRYRRSVRLATQELDHQARKKLILDHQTRERLIKNPKLQNSNTQKLSNLQMPKSRSTEQNGESVANPLDNSRGVEIGQKSRADCPQEEDSSVDRVSLGRRQRAQTHQESRQTSDRISKESVCENSKDFTLCHTQKHPRKLSVDEENMGGPDERTRTHESFPGRGPEGMSQYSGNVSNPPTNTLIESTSNIGTNSANDKIAEKTYRVKRSMKRGKNKGQSQKRKTDAPLRKLQRKTIARGEFPTLKSIEGEELEKKHTQPAKQTKQFPTPDVETANKFRILSENETPTDFELEKDISEEHGQSIVRTINNKNKKPVQQPHISTDNHPANSNLCRVFGARIKLIEERKALSNGGSNKYISAFPPKKSPWNNRKKTTITDDGNTKEAKQPRR